MPNIEISQSDYVRLQRFAVAFVDTPATAFARVLDLAEGQQASPKMEPDETDGVEIFSPDNLPPLTHAKLMIAKIGTAGTDVANWNSALRLALKLVYAQVSSVEETRRVAGINLVQGEKADRGYRFMPEAGFSYQGQSANDAVKCILRCAKFLKQAVHLEFEWWHKDGAYRPGQRGRIKL